MTFLAGWSVFDASRGSQFTEKAGRKCCGARKGLWVLNNAIAVKGNTFYLGVKVSKGAICTFSYSNDGTRFSPVGEPFAARKGKWIGAKVGLFAVRTGKTRETGYVDVDWFRVE